MDKLKKFLDDHAIPEWRTAHKMWSVRLSIFWTVVSALWVALPGFIGYLNPFIFSLISLAFALSLLFARLTHQPGLNSDGK